MRALTRMGWVPWVIAAAACAPVEEPDGDALPAPCVMGDFADAPGAAPQGLAGEKNAVGEYRVWPGGRIPYKIDGGVDSTTKQRLLTAMSDWEAKTGKLVYFEPAKAADAAHLLVKHGSSPVTSFVGYKKDTVTTVKLRTSEYITVIRHELGHVLGLHHEQRRSDRDGFIKVNNANIVNSSLCKSQFSVCTSCVPIVSYNIKSVMHYRSSDLTSCRVDPNMPILLAKDNSKIAHKWVLTQGDLLAIDELYGDGVGGAGLGGAGAGGDQTGGSGGDDSLPGEGGSTSAGGAGGSGAGGTSSGGASAGGSGGSGANGADGGAGVGADGGDGGSSGTASGGAPPGDEGGCSCRVANGAPDDGAWAAALAMLAIARRRRRSHGCRAALQWPETPKA